VRRLPGYGYAGVGRANGARRGEHCAILYRTDRLTLDRQRTRWFSDTPDVPGSRSWGNVLPRIATMAWFTDRSAGAPVGVGDVHLDTGSDEVRARSTAALATWVGEDTGTATPWILMGDFNATPADRSVRRLLDDGWRDALAPLPPAGDDAGTEHGFTGRRDRNRIDLILLGDGWDVIDAGIVHDRPGGRLPSDHWPVAARLRRAP
jgi:endonuclease/exonuclease/phosphatase family metal-dependent hydrolase